MNIPLSRPSISQQELALVSDVIRSGWLSHGEYNDKFETAFATLVGVEHAVSMNSCTSALEVALQVAGVTGEVVLPSFTWVATANAVITSGATPVFCDIDVPTRNVTAQTIAQRLTPRTEAVIVVHFAGQPCAMDEIVALCRDRGLLLIEDSAQTLGATWRKDPVGSFGVGCFSFFPTKAITTCEGGMLSCRDGELAQKARALISHGVASSTQSRESQRRPWEREAYLAGHNFRLPNPLAALGWSQLQRLPELNEKRVQLARRYDQALKALAPQVQPPAVAPEATHAFQMYTIQVPAQIRDQLVLRLRDQGIGASVHFDPPLHVQAYYERWGSGRGSLPQTEGLASEIVTLPIYPDMTEPQQDQVIQALRDLVPSLS